MTAGRIDTHSHLLPGIDDGCPSLAESLMCARVLVAEGYTHSFCTPHFWPNLPKNTPDFVRQQVGKLQSALDEAHVPLRLLPGGEMNFREGFMRTDPAALPSYGMAGQFMLADLWAESVPAFFEPCVKWLQGQGATVILAHPERMKAVQDKPDLVDYFAGLGLLLQGNLQCFNDPPRSATRQVGERLLGEGRYFMLGSDLHNLGTLPHRILGLRRAVELVGEEAVDRLTRTNPAQLLPK